MASRTSPVARRARLTCHNRMREGRPRGRGRRDATGGLFMIPTLARHHPPGQVVLLTASGALEREPVPPAGATSPSYDGLHCRDA